MINALVLEPTVDPEPVQVTYTDAPIPSTWGPILVTPDPTAPLLDGHRARSAGSSVKPTELGRADYLRLIASEVDFWKTKQDANGAIIDPYRNREFQYSTPAFAHAAAALVTYAGRQDLLEAAALSLDWSTRGTRRADRRGRPRGLLRADDRPRNPVWSHMSPPSALQRGSTTSGGSTRSSPTVRASAQTTGTSSRRVARRCSR